MTTTPEDIYELMDYVRDHHTYINRIRTILDFFQQITEPIVVIAIEY